MEDSRKVALDKGEKMYIGKVCSKDERHGDERYTTSGRCVVCAADASREQGSKRKKAIMSEPEIQALLQRGGPNDRATAEAAGLPWYNQPRGYPAQCLHGIIGVAGRCTLCGVPTPELVDVKAELEIDHPMLS